VKLHYTHPGASKLIAHFSNIRDPTFVNHEHQNITTPTGKEINVLNYPFISANYPPIMLVTQFDLANGKQNNNII
jgi:hypothetical protein